jgi:hypothetical protein
MTRRSLTEIRDSIQDYGETKLNLSTSSTAEWKVFIEIFVYAIYVFEGILEIFYNTINTTIQEKQPPTLQWYYDQVLAFQNGDSLIVNDYGILEYESIDEDKKIISQALLVETTVGSVTTLQIKVAKDPTDDGSYEALSNSEKTNFDAYIKAIKAPGTNINTVSTDGDTVKYSLTVLYDPIYSSDNVKSDVEDALDSYKSNVNFVSNVYRAKIIAALLDVDGVVSADFTELKGKEDGGAYDGASIFDYYELQAGYFNWDDDSAITMTDDYEDFDDAG